MEPSVNAAAIGVAVKDGIVTLTGRITDLYGRKWRGACRRPRDRGQSRGQRA